MWCSTECSKVCGGCGGAACGNCSALKRSGAKIAGAIREGDVENVMRHLRTFGVGDETCIVEITVHKLVLHRRRDAPLFAWLTGHKELLHVEMMPLDAPEEGRSTSSGVQEEGINAADKTASETWVWGPVAPANMRSSKNVGEKLVFNARTVSEFSLRAVASHVDWKQDKVPSSCLGEAKFRVDEDVLPAIILGGTLSLPIVSDGRVSGILSATACVRGSDDLLEDSKSKVGNFVLSNRLTRLKGHTAPVTECALFPDGERILTVSLDKTAIVWSLEGQVLLHLRGHTGPVKHCDIFPSGDQVLTVSEDETTMIWSTSGQKLAAFSGTRFCKIFPKGDRILAGGGHNGVIFSSIGEQIATLRGHSDKVLAGAVLPDGQMVVTVSKDDEAIFWSRDGDTLKVLRGHHDAVNACAVFPSGNHVLTVSQDMLGIIWSSSGPAKSMGKQVAVLRGHTGGITDCAVLPSEQEVLTVSEDERGIIWSISGDRLAELGGHTAGIVRCAIFPSGLVLTLSKDKTGIVWTSSGSRLAELYGHTDAICSGLVFPSGQYVLTVSEDSVGIIWPMSLYLPTIDARKSTEWR